MEALYGVVPYKASKAAAIYGNLGTLDAMHRIPKIAAALKGRSIGS